MEKRKLCAVIVAAGRGERMGKDKIILEIAGKPCVAHSLIAFEKAETVTDIIVVTRSDLADEIKDICRKYGIDKFRGCVPGGSCRQESALNGVIAAPCGTEFVAVHDGARPFVQPDEIDRVSRRAFETGAAFCGTHVTDTIKQLNDEGNVTATPDRRSLVAAATPQTFDAKLYKQIAEKMKEALASFTDDAGLFEAEGRKVSFVECGRTNIKITTPEDIAAAEKIYGMLK